MEATGLASLLNEPLLNRRALATRLSVSEGTVEKWTVRKRIPHFRLGHRTVRYNYPSVVASLREVYSPPTSSFSRKLPSRKQEVKRPVRWYQLELNLGEPQLRLNLSSTPAVRKRKP